MLSKEELENIRNDWVKHGAVAGGALGAIFNHIATQELRLKAAEAVCKVTGEYFDQEGWATGEGYRRDAVTDRLHKWEAL